jgi:acetylornithine/N-succinyldiaminopimelate aminotransferase
VIDIIEQDKLLYRCEELGTFIFKGLSNLIGEKSIVKEIRGRGLMLAIELKCNAQQVYEELLMSGFIVAKRPNAEVLRLDPALTVDKSSIESFLQSFAEIITKLDQTKIATSS